MSENEGESRSVGAFLLGFLTGVLVCLGVGGGIAMVASQRTAVMREEMMRAEMEAKAAHDAMKAAESERQARLKAEEALRKNAEKDKDKQK